jgi:predicted DNA-binding transcriptional regulator AlpA
MTDTREHETLIDTTDAAARIGVAEITMRLWRWRDNPHQPPYVRVGARGIRYSPAALDTWKKKRTHNPGTKSTKKNRDPSRRQRRPGPR